MPKLIHAAHFGANKERLAALKVGESFEVPTHYLGTLYYQAGRNCGIGVSVWRIAKGKPEHRVTRTR